MFRTFSKLILLVYLGAHLVSAAESRNGTSIATTTTTTTTAKPHDLSGSETFQKSVHLLRPSNSASNSKSLSYSNSGQGYEQQNNGYANGGYAGQKDGYRNGPSDEYYNGNTENNYDHHGQHQQTRYSQPDDYSNSYETDPYGKHQTNDESSYEEQRYHQPYPDQPAVKSQESSGQDDYSKEDSYESVKGKNSGGRPPFQYAYEVSSSHQDSYDSDEHDTSGKSGYDSGEKEEYSPKVLQHAEYYPKPNPTRYVPQDAGNQAYGSGEHKDNYFPSVPKEAGYVSNGQKEPEYLQSPHHEPSYSKQAGYSPRDAEPAAFLPMIPKKKPVGLTHDGKVAVYIKHLGHKTPGTDQHVSKERQGFLLLPVVHKKMEEKLKELQGHITQEYKQGYQGDKKPSFHQRPVADKQIYVQPKVLQYPAKVTTVQHAPAYALQEPVKPQAKTEIRHVNYRVLKPVVKQVSYEHSEYDSPQSQAYSADDSSDAGPVQYVSKIEAGYEEQPEVKTYSKGAIEYGGPQTDVPSYTGSIKYEPKLVYVRKPQYLSPYDVTTTERKSIPIKVQPSSYTSLSHATGYPRIVDLSSIANKAKKSSPVASRLYSTQYGNISPRLTSAYEHASFDLSPEKEKSLSIVLQKHREPAVVPFRPSSYSSKGRISAKALVEDFGLHDYEHFLSKPKHATSAGSLYYDLHAFPARHHVYPRYGYRRSGVVAPRKLAL